MHSQYVFKFFLLFPSSMKYWRLIQLDNCGLVASGVWVAIVYGQNSIIRVIKMYICTTERQKNRFLFTRWINFCQVYRKWIHTYVYCQKKSVWKVFVCMFLQNLHSIYTLLCYGTLEGVEDKVRKCIPLKLFLYLVIRA